MNKSIIEPKELSIRFNSDNALANSILRIIKESGVFDISESKINQPQEICK